MSPSTLSSFLRDSYASGIQKASADREGQESSTRERSYSMVCANMEGVKLDLLILQKKVEKMQISCQQILKNNRNLW